MGDSWLVVLQDISYSTSDYIMKTGATRDTFYCPAYPGKNGDLAIYWQYAQAYDGSWPADTPTGKIPEPLTNRDDYFRVTAYFWMMDIAPPDYQDQLHREERLQRSG